jgi:soluble lytic murein transglycosylase
MTLRTNAFHLFMGLGAVGFTALLGIPTSRPTAERSPVASPERTTSLVPPAPLMLDDTATGSTGNALAAISGMATRSETAPQDPLVVAYAPDPTNDSAGNPILRAPSSVRTDIDGLREAISAYRSGDLAKGDTEAARIPDPLARLAVEWVALQTQPKAAGFARLSAFLTDHPDWPARASLRKRAEELIYLDKNRPAIARAWFANRAPQTAYGKVALARARQAEGKDEDARALVADVWRRDDVTQWLEIQIMKEFGSILTKEDHRARAIRQTYQHHGPAALRAAALAGDDMPALVKARLAVDKEESSDKLMQAVPAALQKDPMYILSNIQRLRRANKLDEAAKAMFEAPRDPALLGDADEWWTERRVLARKLLDAKNPKDAYRICAEHAATGREAAIEAEFHAGWIALRFLEDPALAARHFESATRRAETPISRARTAYWQGRAAEAQGHRDEALAFYRTAAENPIAYYGQLASARLGETAVALRQPRAVAKGELRAAPIRVVELLQALDQADLAQALAIETTRNLGDEAQVAALADVVARSGDAGATLTIGKLATQRGHLLDETAFPTFGIPAFSPLGNSAALPIVYSIARQESAFAPKALSQAGAKGLMQMIDSTARRTAQQMGVAFDKARMTQDPAFNAQLGAAHLGQLLGEYRGSYILTFAAYNAGGKRVKEWIGAYGDPRDPAVDPIDWVEHIPFTETRNYVQRVIENLEMYKIRFGDTRAFAIESDLRGAQAKL